MGIAANKSDLYEQSEVSDEEGKKYAKKIKAIWKLTSALKENKGIDKLIEELLNNYINYEEKGNNEDVKIKLDKSSFSKDNNKEEGCCINKKNKNENNIRYRSNYSSTSVISKSLSEDNDSSEF